MRNYFTLPGMFYLQNLNSALWNLKNEHEEYFLKDRFFNSVYGNIPNCIWNGENMLFSARQRLATEIDLMFQTYTLQGTQLILNFTNTELSEADVDNVFSNIILKHALNANFNTKCVVNSKSLYEYLLKEYPEIVDIYIGKYNDIALNNDLPISYFLHTNYNNNFELLKQLKYKSSVVITVNPMCYCEKLEPCVLKENIAQLTYDPESCKRNACPVLQNNFTTLNHRQFPTYISNELIAEYNKIGFNHFVLEEFPCLSQNVEEYLYYFIKPEFYSEARVYLSIKGAYND